jgi:pentatricopeptide repeat protein
MKRKNLIVLALFTSALIVGTQVQAAKTLPSKKATEAEKCYSKEDRKKEVSCTNNVSMAGDTYLNATRVQPEVPKSKIQSDWSSLAKTDITKDPDGVIYAAQKVFDNPGANVYEKSIAALMLSQAYRPKDITLSTDYAIKAIELNGLDNNMHYQMMDMLSKFLFDAKRYEEALLYSTRYSTETGIKSFDVLYFQGNVLYRLGRYAEAIVPLKTAYESDRGANQNLSSMLMDSYSKTNQKTEAEKISKALAKKVSEAAKANPDDKALQAKQLDIYARSGEYEKAALLFDDMHAKGQITTFSEYEAGYISYYNWPDHEEQTIKIINEGLSKKVIPESDVVYQLLGHANYMSNNSAAAIDAWTKGAALSANGEQNLLLAQIYREENEYTKSKAEAQKALSKGVKNKEQANKLLNQATDK